MKKPLAIIVLLFTFLAVQSVTLYARDEKATNTEKQSQTMEKCCAGCPHHRDNSSGKMGKKMESKSGCCQSQAKATDTKKKTKND